MQVQCTRDYDKFQTNDYNRPLCIEHINRLAAITNFEKSFPYHPIIVNQDFVIIDGHHRYAAARIRQIPIYYMIQPGATEEHIMECNANQKHWEAKDYLDYHVKRNNPDFIFISAMREEYKIHMSLLNLVINRIGTTKNKDTYAQDFKMGKLEVNNKDEVRRFLLETIPVLKQVKSDHGFEKTRHFFTQMFFCAMISIFLTDEKVYQNVMRYFQQKWTKIPVRSTTNEYVKDLLLFAKGPKKKIEVIRGRKSTKMVQEYV